MTQALEEPRPRRLQAVGGRVPPHNLEAEESVLGAMLLSRDAIAAALECCSADDFYKPAHTHVFAAITSLYTRGEPADPVTVAEELRRTGVIESVGDPSLLVSLQVNTPSTANAGHYARIVEEHALLRRLVAVAGEIAELGYSVPEDVTEVVDRAETLVFEVAQRRVVDTLSPLRDLLAASLDHLEHLYEREETITGIPTGYVDLDERLAGLQPSNLVVVGARPAMGKALPLDTPVPTPTGWSTMGQLRPGDLVYDEHGHPTRVHYVSPVFLGHRCLRVRFDDGSSLVADAGHRWLVWDEDAWAARQAHSRQLVAGLVHGSSPEAERVPVDTDPHPRVVTTADMAAAGVLAGDGRPRWSVPVAGALDGPAAVSPVDPYVLGWWLAAGTDDGLLQVPAAHAPDVVAEFERLGYWLARRPGGAWATVTIAAPVAAGGSRAGAGASGATDTTGAADIGPATGRGAGRPGPWRDLAEELRDPACAAARRRRIPDALRRGTAKQRLALLQGVMDACGAVSADRTSVVLRLAGADLLGDVAELAVSLGHRVPPPGLDLVGGSGDPRRDATAAGAWRLRWQPADPVFRVPAKAEPLGAALAARVPHGDHTRRVVTAVDEVASVPVRCIAVDTPSHLFLAGRAMVPTHNTSFALGIVSHAAMAAKKPVLLFSLEMSHLELTQRMLCSEARVDATRMRNGRLLDSDWPKISDAIGRLGDAPIFIDDNPNVTVMDIRAKARRLMAREGLGLVVIDYLQLMTGRNRAENRQVEVSEISRGLKILARELNVPVIALSQLSRSLEMRQDKRPVLADLRESGCLTADTRVTRADTGAEVTMGELLLTGERDIPVWALDDRLRMVPATMTHVFPSGVKRTFEIRLASGRRVQGSANHPFRTVQGWRRLDELVVGDRLATPRALPAPRQRTTWREADVVLLAHMLGDGCMVARQPLHYTSADGANLQAVEEAAKAFGVTGRRVSQGSWAHVYLPAPYRLARGKRNPIAEWLDDLGVFGLRSYDKFVPSSVFSLSDDQLALFLRHLWATDGCLWWDGRGQVRCYYASTSRRLIDDVQALLLRFGIVGRIRETRKGSHRPCYQLHLSGRDHLLTFVQRIGVHGERGSNAAAIADHLRRTVHNTNVDTVPKAVWGDVLDAAGRAGLSHRGLSAAAGWAYAGSSRYRYNPSRAALNGVADLLDDDHLRDLAASDIFWDEVVAIDDRGDMPVYDATVLEHHNFMANGVIAHNSIEQDADVVLFIYRDEVYNPDSEDRGTAEVIISKHRNGPVGNVQLAFVDHYTRFANMARV